MRYSRQNPSPKYTELLACYRSMHMQGFDRVVGDQKVFVPPDEAFPGNELPKFAQPIKNLLNSSGSKTVLDYGSGKGKQYECEIRTVAGEVYPNMQAYWEVDDIVCYDPALPDRDTLPSSAFDTVVCTDVLEHVPEEDTVWVLNEIFSLSSRCVFANICCLLAHAVLPNGENAHCNVKPIDWWYALFEEIAKLHQDRIYLLALSYREEGEQKTQVCWRSNLELV